MSFKKKMKIERFVYIFLGVLGFFCVGRSIGIFIDTVKKTTEKKMTGLEHFIMIAALLLIIFAAIYINICLHETGHLIFGIMTGYRFNSIRFGRLMLAKKEDGKLHFCRYNMPGTGGQCIMSAPDTDTKNMPVVLYNLGGIIMNMIVFLIGAGIYFGLKDSYPTIGISFLIFAMTSLVIFILNGIPLPQMGTDGANAIILSKDTYARVALKNQLETIRYLADNYSIREMPAELFSFDRSVPMTNPLITSQAVSCLNYYCVNKMYPEAKEMAIFILENAKSINQLHEKILYGELLFMTIVVDRDNESARKQFESHKKELLKTAGFISIQRDLYAYYSLVEKDEKKAAQYARRFENSVKHYPYPKDAAIEKEQFDMVATLG